MILRLILGDQLSFSLPTLNDIDPQHDRVLMLEVAEETSYVPHHQQKITLILSAMRHFAEGLRARGITVDYVRLDDSENTGSFDSEVMRAIKRLKPQALIVTEAGEWRVQEKLKAWHQSLNIPVEIRDDTRFLTPPGFFSRWAVGKKQLRMEFFYREMRRLTGWLMQGDQPLGGQWNYDAENRKALPKDLDLPQRRRFAPDAITQEVITLVKQRFAKNIGEAEQFTWPVTHSEAKAALNDFLEQGLTQFGDYQDAMRHGEDFVFHALLSPCLNIGLLDPREVCEAALERYAQGGVPLAAIEGFIRQILGWREYVRGIYWHHMPDYAHSNFLDAQRPLPQWYWSGETDMHCLAEAIRNTREHAYAHHIQRLMVTGNFALLAGLCPSEVEAWYLAVYADAFEWVELPNTHGMVLHADGGIMASKPYAASGAYIDRMSDYCRHCRYSPKQKLGDQACPLNYLYWDFIMRHEKRLAGNPRMAMPYRNLKRMDSAQKQAIQDQAAAFLATLGPC
ncbi:deoxyribodipyrimidine photolyase-related protein [Ectothiorhodosinus mongolicus]|uniref:Deoxyribodipyrimidine photolyase-related protein n=1 Tax=Ectothiorhodosinus mongolicus TaxID=233100 RepID=A0A1R3VN43_9GAMM|nr:cryptochrome/photolyase family protein [Ectothiorhodosinus mongolicus]ULX56451.1 cryptochrome/photolyase family protein [Ectothiorhodosinus mongolicus]SIT66001.1 deoxyribodipyrimidine photolyase-related protein [Ectothiorhodosinus mongolicus]